MIHVAFKIVVVMRVPASEQIIDMTFSGYKSTS